MEDPDPRTRRAALHATEGEESWVRTLGYQLSTWRKIDRIAH